MKKGTLIQRDKKTKKIKQRERARETNMTRQAKLSQNWLICMLGHVYVMETLTDKIKATDKWRQIFSEAKRTHRKTSGGQEEAMKSEDTPGHYLIARCMPRRKKTRKENVES